MFHKKCQNIFKNKKKSQKKGINMAKKEQKMPKRAKSTKKCSIFGPFGHLFQTILKILCHSDSVQQTKKLFIAVTQCNKQNKSFAQ